MALFIWNDALVVDIAASAKANRLAFGLPANEAVLYTSDDMKVLVQDKSTSISQLTKGKLKDFQKLIKYFNGTTSSVLVYYY